MIKICHPLHPIISDFQSEAVELNVAWAVMLEIVIICHKMIRRVQLSTNVTFLNVFLKSLVESCDGEFCPALLWTKGKQGDMRQ